MVTQARVIPDSYYYSGQGRLGIGERDVDTGVITNFFYVGNVTSLTIDIAVTKFEHKESMTGERAIDLTIIQERNATFKFTAESLKLDLLSVGLYGESSTVAGATNTTESHVACALGGAVPLLHPNVTAASTSQGVEGTDWSIDLEMGVLNILSNATLAIDEVFTCTYTHGAYDQLDAFTTGTPPERFLRFDGLNTVTGDPRILEIYRAAFDPLTGLEFINEELGSGELGGNILPNNLVTNPVLSKYFRERRFTPA